ncbi:MAG: hypothetical protein ACYSU7_04820 [Planctomycetota bacterium]|jgi:hypothetical protein
MPVSRIGHTPRRHPTCPHCGYDLVATVDAGGRVCPECGYEFELSELGRSAMPGDWTPARGLRRLVAVVAIRAAVCLVVWTVLLVALSMLCGGVRSVAPAGVLMAVWVCCGVLVLISGAVVGAVVGRRLEEAAGFRAPFLLAVPIIAAAVAIVGGATLAAVVGHGMLGGPGISITAAFLAAVLIVRGYLASEY